MIKVRIRNTARVCQGDIFRDVSHIEYARQRAGELEVSKIVFPLVLVLTQDCDLEQDYRVRWSKTDTPDDDKMLFSVLVAPIYNVEHLRAGEHLQEIGRSMQRLNTEKLKLVKSNQTARYHFLEFPDSVPLVPCVVDFKHYFSIGVEELKSVKPKQFVCKVAEIYREDVSQRFASFLSRIGLP